MLIDYDSWTNFKSDIIAKGFVYNYQTMYNGYKIFVVDRQLIWSCYLLSADDISDFETNYKSNANKCLYDIEGKEYIRSETRPLNCTTVFTCNGDTCGETPSIGTGNRLKWDASVNDGWTTEGCQEGFKKYVVEIQFCDSVWIKEGTVYYMNALKDSCLNMQVLCPNGGYYMYLGQIQQNTTGNDLIVDHYMNNHPIQGSVPMGDELNAESCSQELPSYLKYRFTATVPTSDTSSYGYIELEIYRQRSVVL